MSDDTGQANMGSFGRGAIIATDEQTGADGSAIHYMRLSPDLEATIREMAESIRVLRQEVHLLRVRLAAEGRASDGSK